MTGQCPVGTMGSGNIYTPLLPSPLEPLEPPPLATNNKIHGEKKRKKTQLLFEKLKISWNCDFMVVSFAISELTVETGVNLCSLRE